MLQALNIVIDVQTGDAAQLLAAVLGEAGAQTALAQALGSGLMQAANEMSEAVREAAIAAGLTSRTGTLLNSITYWPAADPLTCYVGVPNESPAAHYAYLLTDEDVQIVPKGHKYLAIPMGDNLQGSGTPRYDSPRQLADLGQVEWRGRTVGLLIGGEYHPYFALVESVWIFGRGVLESSIEAQTDEAAKTIRSHVEQLIATGGG